MGQQSQCGDGSGVGVVPPAQKATREASEPAPPAPGAPPAGRLPRDLTDRANAELFAFLYSGQFRYVVGNGWYSWDTGRWKLRGGETAATWAAGGMADQMPTCDPTGRFSQQEVTRHRRYSSSTAGVKAMPHQATAAPTLSLDVLGYSITGDVGAQILPFCRGRGDTFGDDGDGKERS